LFNHPESIRSCGFQNVTINIPQASYRTKIEQGKGDPEVDSETWKLFIDQIDAAMDLAVKAHLQKKKHIANLMSAPNMPLWQIGKPANDGKPYVDLEKCVYIIGLIGLDDACRYLFGKSMHEDEKLTTWGLSVIAHMNLRAKEYTKEHGITFTLEESPAESAARRLARSDLAHFPEQAKGIVNGSEGNEYYTNSVHIPAYANVSLVERIVRQAMFHGMIDSGAITHAFIGEETPSAGAISEIVERTFRETQSAQITFSPEFTYCMDCCYGTRGIKKTCDMCGSSNVEAETRVVGYFSRISQWNKSKQFGELVDRHRGNYSVEEADK
jgi:ribonucleoside-triphosphate reductase